jgi:hypothetical protein
VSPCLRRHCEEQSDEAIQFSGTALDCFAGARNDERIRSRDAPAPRVMRNHGKNEFERTKAREAERRKARLLPAASSGCGSAPCASPAIFPSPACGGGSGRGRARSPLGAPPRLLLRRPNATTQLRAALPGSPDASGLEALSGASAASTSQTGHHADPDDARSRPSADRNSARGYRTRSVFRPTSGSRPSVSEIRGM